jgi:cellobiose phosphorylase
MEYGYFDKYKNEYIITRPDTPTPWINYLNNGRYCAMISNTGGGYSFHIDPKERRILRYRYNNLPLDRPGRYIYIKDINTKENWSPTWQPILKTLDTYKCHHGLGYTQINSSYKSILSELIFFVPASDDIEICYLKLKNSSNIEVNLQIFTYAEFCLWDAVSDQQDLQYIQNIAISKYDDNLKAIVFHYFDKSKLFAFFHSNNEISGFDCERESFIGKYHSESNPICVQNGECNNSNASGGNPIAATSMEISLKAGENKDFIFILGVTNNCSQIKSIIERYNTKEKIKDSLKELNKNWSEYLEKFNAVTPDNEFNLLINTWNQYQSKTTFDWSRYASFYETGIGRGIGFRDFNQDTLGVCHAIPNQVRKKLLDITKMQFKDGKVFHKYFPLTGKGDYPHYVNPRMKFFGDDHLWMILAVSNYIKETGDLSILNENVKFVEGTQDKLFNHLERALEFTEKNKGPHGFPLIGTADWNDTLQLHGPNMKAESVMVAMQYHKALVDMAELSKEINETEKSYDYYERATRTKIHINDRAWDGKWYIRAIDDNGNTIGSHKNEEGKIYLNTQSWSVYSEVATTERAISCMNAIREFLVTDYGIKLLFPPYSRFYPELGGISTFPPGLKENGSIFCHTNPWAEIAECIIGRGDFAYEYYVKIAGTTKNKYPDIHMTEPYVYSQMITGNDHPKFGAAKNSWLTGTASWTLKAATDWILGIRPEYHGLKIDPCIPKSWDNFRVRRHFRGKIYDIEVQNPDNISKGVKKIIIDKVSQENNLIYVSNHRKEYKVQVIMG